MAARHHDLDASPHLRREHQKLALALKVTQIQADSHFGDAASPPENSRQVGGSAFGGRLSTCASNGKCTVNVEP